MQRTTESTCAKLFEMFLHDVRNRLDRDKSLYVMHDRAQTDSQEDICLALLVSEKGLDMIPQSEINRLRQAERYLESVREDLLLVTAPEKIIIEKYINDAIANIDDAIEEFRRTFNVRPYD